MSWEKEVEQIGKWKTYAEGHGGEDALGKHHERGKLAIRERMRGLLDDGSLREVGKAAGARELDAEGNIVGFTPANYALGTGSIDGRTVVVGGEDFTIRGGSPSVAGLRKSVFAETLALRYRVPLIRLLEGAGGSVKGAAGGGKPTPPDMMNQPARFLSIARLLREVPVASAALGPVAGMPAARLCASHFTVMTKKTSQVMIAGPALVERALGQTLTKEELGGPQVHLKSGVVHNLAEDEADAFAQIRRFLSYLPTRAGAPLPIIPCDDPSDRECPELIDIVPRDRRKTYKMRRIIESVFDQDSFFEIQPKFGASQITGFARLAGHPVGVLANDPMYYAGSMTAQAAEKLTRFVELCDTFGLPVVSLVDQPGFMIGPRSEAEGTIRVGTAAICAVMRTRMPWVSVMVRKSYGVAAAAHYGPEATVYAWPSAEAGPLPIEGGVAVAFRREIAAAESPEQKRRELEDMLSGLRDPYAPTEAASLQDMIDPRHTRRELCAWLALVTA